MTTYVTISSSDLDAESPLDTDLITALARNPDAYAEDDATCPVFKGRVKAAQATAPDTESIASVALASGQSMLAIACGFVTYGGWPMTGSDDITVSLKHDGTTLASQTFAIDSQDAPRRFSFTLMALTTTADSGALDVSISGYSSPVTATIKGQIAYLKFNTP